jgi:predicted molibdopterin-dependent oxidoreductase YjgC
MAAIPAAECARAEYARKLLARNVETSIARGAGCQHHNIVERHQLLKTKVTANLNVAEEADAVTGKHAVQHTRNRLRALMVRSNPIPDKSEWHGQPFEDVDGSIGNQAKQAVRQVTTRRTATDDGYLSHSRNMYCRDAHLFGTKSARVRRQRWESIFTFSCSQPR